MGAYFKMQPIAINILPGSLRKKSYYDNVQSFNFYSFNLTQKRSNFKNISLFSSLFKKQKGLCSFCNMYIQLFEKEKIEIHHIIKLSECDNMNKIKIANRKENLRLMHQSCHKLLHQNEKMSKMRGFLI